MPSPSALSRLGSGVGGPIAFAIARAVDRQADAILAVIAEIVTGPNLWEESLPPWALDLASLALTITPDPSWTRAEWLYGLRLHAQARTSDGSLPVLIRLAQTASPISVGTVFGHGSGGILVYVGGGSDLSDADRETLISAFILARPLYAGMQILSSTIAEAESILTLDDPDLGLDLGLLADTLYA